MADQPLRAILTRPVNEPVSMLVCIYLSPSPTYLPNLVQSLAWLVVVIVSSHKWPPTVGEPFVCLCVSRALCKNCESVQLKSINVGDLKDQLSKLSRRKQIYHMSCATTHSHRQVSSSLRLARVKHTHR